MFTYHPTYIQEIFENLEEEIQTFKGSEIMTKDNILTHKNPPKVQNQETLNKGGHEDTYSLI